MVIAKVIVVFLLYCGQPVGAAVMDSSGVHTIPESVLIEHPIPKVKGLETMALEISKSCPVKNHK